MPDPPFQPDEISLAQLQGSIKPDMQSLDKRGVLAFIELLVNLARYRIRVAETVEFAERGLIHHVSVEFSLPASALSAKFLYLPVLMPLKGELLDNFRLYDASGTSLADLSYEEATRLAAVGLRYLLSADARPENEDRSDVNQALAVDEIVLLGPVARRGRINRDKIESEIDERLRAVSIAISEPTRQRLHAYLIALSVTYPIVVVVPHTATVAGRILIKYERTVIPVSERQGLEGRLRLALGLRPHQLAIPVDLAYSVGSYHLTINGPLDKYVIRQYLRCRHCGRLVRRDWQGSMPDATSRCRHATSATGQLTRATHFRLRQRRGQSYVHLYMRGYAKDNAPRDLEFLALFREVPPGSIANAAATALVTTLLIVLAGYVSTHSSGSEYSDLPALILALPVAAASWLGISEDTGQIVGSSLLGRISLILSGLVSICSIIAYLILTPEYEIVNDHLGTREAYHVPGADPIGVFGIHNLWWSALIGLSFLNLAYASFRLSVRLTYYNYLRVKRDADEAEYGN
jgi:hypothetical protein